MLERYQIRVVPLTVQFDQESYLDTIEIQTEQLFRKVAEQKRLPKTASPSPAAFQTAFAEATADGSEAIYIGISSQFSSTVQNAKIAADLIPGARVTVFGSENLSTGIGLLVLLAADLIEAGKSRTEIVAALTEARPKVRSSFMIDTMEYLRMGGRCSGVTALAGTLLRIRPIIAVENGGMVVAGKVRGARQKGLDWMLERFARDVQAGLVSPKRLFITHTGTPEDAQYMIDYIRRTMPAMAEVLETAAGSVIGSHCGPGTIGILHLLR